MAFSYKTPGAYIEEIVKLPPSVAQVETAIPLFMGVTSMATDITNQDLVGVSKKITSMAEYRIFYGSADVANASVLVKLNNPSSASLTSAYNNVMYYSLLHYFDNGGGPCYIHSIGQYDRSGVNAQKYKDELAKLNLVDEVTLVVVPDIAGLTKDQAYDVYNTALLQANQLQDKFVLIDVRMETNDGLAKSPSNRFDANKSKTDFRSTISSNTDSIKYGAAYYPHIHTTYSYDFTTAKIKMTFEQAVIDTSPSSKLLNNMDYNISKSLYALSELDNFFNDDYFLNIATELFVSKINEINRKVAVVQEFFTTTEQNTLLENTKKVTDRMKALGDTAVADNEPKFDYKDTVAGKEKETLKKQLTDKALAIANEAATKAIIVANGANFTNYATLNTNFLSKIISFFNSLFEAKLKEAFAAIPLNLPPSPAVAGLYAYVDRTRGVWKAPANVSMTSTVLPLVQLSDLDQADFNVDAENGKSINCIRNFVGRGNMVWGARTLAGNNNEWRYVNVRRLFNMVEESCQNASRQFIFEPNDANTWVRVKGMIDNFLINLWRDGALQGAKPEHAFYCAVGLNQTMTADDILNGLMIVEIGLAAVRPAEFIVLRFSHKLAES